MALMTGYDLFYLALAPIAGPLLAYKAAVRGKYRESVPAMFGRLLAAEDQPFWSRGCVWVHAVSFGEVVAAKAMLPLLRQKFNIPILLTTVTETGQAQARTAVPALADAARYYPADFSWIVRRFVDVYKPRVVMLMETELWPNSLRAFSDAGARVFVANGKISANSFTNYRRLRPLLREPLSRVNAWCMQTERDAERVRALCGAAAPVFATGNCKFDVPFPDVSPERAAELRRMCGLEEGRPVVVVGSTHPGEEEFVLGGVRRFPPSCADAVTLLVPRHPERFGAVWKAIVDSGISAFRLSDGLRAGGEKPRLVLVDKMGLLAQLYAIADVAVVAGSFVSGIGGHNLLEAAYHGVPVIRGPHMEQQPDMVRILDAADAAICSEGAALGETIVRLLDDASARREIGRRGREAVLANRGAAVRNMEIIERYL